MAKKTKILEGKTTLVLKNLVITFSLLALLTPFIFNLKMYFPINSPKAFYFMAMVQVAFFAWLILAVHNKNYRPKANLILTITGLFIVFLIINTFLSHNPSLSFWSNYERTAGLLIYFHFFAFFLLLFSTLKTSKDWVLILGSSVSIAAVVSVIGMADNFEIISLGKAFQRGSTLGNTSFMGTYLLMNFFPALYLWLRKEGVWKSFYLLNLFLILLGIALNPGGRAMKGALFVAMLVMLVLYLAFVYRQKIVRKIAKTVIVLGIIFFIVAGFMVFQEDNVIREKTLELHGMHGRLTVWDSAWQGFLEKPLIGWGLESFDFVFLKYFNPKMFLPEYGNEVWFDRAHNIVFDSLVTKGLVGTVLFFGIFAIAIFSLWRKYLKEDEIDFLAPIIFSSFLIAYFIQGLTVFDMVSSYMMLFLILAFITSLCFSEDDRQKGNSFNYLSLLFLIPFILSFSYFILQPYKSSTLAIASARFKNTTQEIDYYQKALDSSPMGREQLRRFFAIKFLGEYKKEIKEIEEEIESAEIFEERVRLQEKLVERKSLIDEKFVFAKKETRKNIEESPSFRDYWRMAVLYNNYFEFKYLDRLLKIHSEDRQKENEEFIKEAKEIVLNGEKYAQEGIKLSPKNLQGYQEEAQAKINRGKIYLLLNEQEKAQDEFKEALSLIEKTIQLEPLLVDSHVKAVEIAKVLLSDDDLAEEKIKEAVEIDPSWEEIFKIEL